MADNSDHLSLCCRTGHIDLDGFSSSEVNSTKDATGDRYRPQHGHIWHDMIANNISFGAHFDS